MEERRIAFNFFARNLSMPVSYFVVSLERARGERQKLCKDHADDRALRRDYENKDASGVFTQEFRGLEENSLYTVKLTSMFDVFGTPRESTFVMMFETLPAGKT